MVDGKKHFSKEWAEKNIPVDKELDYISKDNICLLDMDSTIAGYVESLVDLSVVQRHLNYVTSSTSESVHGGSSSSYDGRGTAGGHTYSWSISSVSSSSSDSRPNTSNYHHQMAQPSDPTRRR